MTSVALATIIVNLANLQGQLNPLLKYIKHCNRPTLDSVIYHLRALENIIPAILLHK